MRIATKSSASQTATRRPTPTPRPVPYNVMSAAAAGGRPSSKPHPSLLSRPDRNDIRKYILGIDVGTTWSTSRYRLNADGQIEQLDHTTLNSFSVEIPGTSSKAKNVQYREVKAMRARYTFRARQRRRLCRHLVEIGMLPDDRHSLRHILKTWGIGAVAGDGTQSDPFALRARALTEILSPEDLARVLLHISVNRGSRLTLAPEADEDDATGKETRTGDTGNDTGRDGKDGNGTAPGRASSASSGATWSDEKKKDDLLAAAGVKHMRERMAALGAETVGAFRHTLKSQGLRTKVSPLIVGNETKGYDFYPAQVMIREEVRLICERQRAFHEAAGLAVPAWLQPDYVTNSSGTGLADENGLIFFQRPLKPQRRGLCAISPLTWARADRQRSPRGLLGAEIHHQLVQLSNTRIVLGQADIRRDLTLAERTALLELITSAATAKISEQKIADLLSCVVSDDDDPSIATVSTNWGWAEEKTFADNKVTYQIVSVLNALAGGPAAGKKASARKSEIARAVRTLRLDLLGSDILAFDHVLLALAGDDLDRAADALAQCLEALGFENYDLEHVLMSFIAKGIDRMSATYSPRALDLLNRRLEQLLRGSDAIVSEWHALDELSKEGALTRIGFESIVPCDKLDYYGRHVPWMLWNGFNSVVDDRGNRIVAEDGTILDPVAFFGRIPSNTVHVFLNQIGLVVNAHIAETGMRPSKIIIENTRSLMNPQKVKDKIRRENQRQRYVRAALGRALTHMLGRVPSGTEHDRCMTFFDMALAEELARAREACEAWTLGGARGSVPTIPSWTGYAVYVGSRSASKKVPAGRAATVGYRKTNSNSGSDAGLADLPIDTMRATDPYSLKTFGIRDVLFAGADPIEVEHIIPLSRSGDQSKANLILAHRSSNSAKGNLTPYEAFSGKALSGFNFKAIQAHILRVYGQKNTTNPSHYEGRALRFTKKGAAALAGDEALRSRYLPETAFMARFAKAYLAAVTEGGAKNVITVSGTATAIVRRYLGILSLHDEVIDEEIDAYGFVRLIQAKTARRAEADRIKWAGSSASQGDGSQGDGYQGDGSQGGVGQGHAGSGPVPSRTRTDEEQIERFRASGDYTRMAEAIFQSTRFPGARRAQIKCVRDYRHHVIDAITIGLMSHDLIRDLLCVSPNHWINKAKEIANSEAEMRLAETDPFKIYSLLKDPSFMPSWKDPIGDIKRALSSTLLSVKREDAPGGEYFQATYYGIASEDALLSSGLAEQDDNLSRVRAQKDPSSRPTLLTYRKSIDDLSASMLTMVASEPIRSVLVNTTNAYMRAEREIAFFRKAQALKGGFGDLVATFDDASQEPIAGAALSATIAVDPAGADAPANTQSDPFDGPEEHDRDDETGSDVTGPDNAGMVGALLPGISKNSLPRALLFMKALRSGNDLATLDLDQEAAELAKKNLGKSGLDAIVALRPVRRVKVYVRKISGGAKNDGTAALVQGGSGLWCMDIYASTDKSVIEIIPRTLPAGDRERAGGRTDHLLPPATSMTSHDGTPLHPLIRLFNGDLVLWNNVLCDSDQIRQMPWRVTTLEPSNNRVKLVPANAVATQNDYIPVSVRNLIEGGVRKLRMSKLGRPRVASSRGAAKTKRNPLSKAA